MARIKRARPWPTSVVAVLALVAALAGSAVAEQATTAGKKLNKKETKQVKKIAKKKAKKQDKKQDKRNFPVDASQIAGGAVIKPKIAQDAVSSGKIKKRAVGSGKISAQAVKTGKIADQAVRSGKVQGGAIGPEKLSAGAIPIRAFAQIVSGNVVAGAPRFGITNANVSNPEDGVQCISGLGFTPSGAMATVVYDASEDDEVAHTEVGAVGMCAVGTQITVSTFDPGTPGLEDKKVTVLLW